MKKFITLTLQALNIPLNDIYISEKIKLDEKYLWTKERIVEAIKKDASYLQHQAQRNYHSSIRR